MIPRLKSGQDGWSISIIDKNPESYGAIHHAPYQHDSKNCAEKNADLSQSQKIIRCSWAKSLQICIVDGSTATFHDLRLDPVKSPPYSAHSPVSEAHPPQTRCLTAFKTTAEHSRTTSGFMAMIFIGIKNQPFYPAW